MQPWQVILIIFIYDIIKGLCTEFLNWKDESSSSSTSSETNNTTPEDVVMEQDKNDLETAPLVTPQKPRCKECKWWKDSDGKYRRGYEAESKCPINTNTVYRGEGYCYMFSSKADLQ